jgi:hypothetical protein
MKKLIGHLLVICLLPSIVFAGATTPADNFSNPSSPILSFSLVGIWDGTAWDRLPGDSTNGIKVQGTISGNTTPTDSFANPTNASVSFSLQGIWNGTTWDRLRGWNTSDGFTVATAQAVINAPLVWNGVTWDRWKSGVNTGQALIDSSSNASNNITTNTTTTVKATAGVVNAVIINTAGTSSTAAFYNVAGASCTGTPGTGYVFTLTTTAIALDSNINHTFTNGICVVTAGAAAANISVLYR